MIPFPRLILVAAVLLAPVSGTAQEKLTDNTFKAAPGQSPPPATLADVAWLEGSWRGIGLGGLVEEIWSAPAGGSMMGMFRLLVDGAAVFYEFELIVEDKGSLLLRLKHFNRDFSGWEEKVESVDFPLVWKDGRNMHFEGLSFQPRGDDTLTVYVAIRTRDGGYREEVFSYTRDIATGG